MAVQVSKIIACIALNSMTDQIVAALAGGRALFIPASNMQESLHKQS